MKHEVCVLKRIGDPAPGYKTMSMDDVRDYMDTCKSVMNGWKIAALSDGKFDGAGYGHVLTPGDHMNTGYIGWKLVMTGAAEATPEMY